MDGLEIRSSDIHGRGVFATRAFAAGDTVERCPAVVVSPADRHLLDGTHLFNYYFYWEGEAAAIALGYGSLYNHSASPSARYRKVSDADVIEFVAVRDIEPGCEITVDSTPTGARMSCGSCRDGPPLKAPPTSFPMTDDFLARLILQHAPAGCYSPISTVAALPSSSGGTGLPQSGSTLSGSGSS